MTVRPIVLAHRWLGVILCLLFCCWFVSGATLIYVPFPSLPHEEMLRRAPAVSPEAVNVDPGEAVARSGATSVASVRLVEIDREPVYIVEPRTGAVVAIRARDGVAFSTVTPEIARAVAMRFSGATLRELDGPFHTDQWVVDNDFDPYRPFYRARLDEHDATDLYVSARTGEIMQRTTASQRRWNYVGAVVHWIYPTFIRRNWVAWDQLVWWVSLAGVTVAVLGLWLGIQRIPGRQRSGAWRWSAYRGWLRWHHILGMCAGVLALSWIFSGWLSMDHNRLFSPPNPDAEHLERFQGIPLAAALEGVSADALKQLGSFQEAQFHAVGGATFVNAVSGETAQLFELEQGTLEKRDRIDEARIRAGVANAWPGSSVSSVNPVAADDTYTQLRHMSLPSSAIRVVLADPAATWIHIDSASGTVLGVMDRSRRIYRWLRHGLHSFDFPGLARHRPLWDALILLCLAMGFTFSATALVVGLKRLILTARP